MSFTCSIKQHAVFLLFFFWCLPTQLEYFFFLLVDAENNNNNTPLNMLHVFLAAAFIASVFAYRNKVRDAFEDEEKRGIRQQEFVVPGGHDYLDRLEKTNDPGNRGYLRPNAEQTQLGVNTPETQVLTPAGRELLFDPKFQAAYLSNYAEQTDRNHPLLQFARRKYLYSATRSIVTQIGSPDDLAIGGIYTPFP